MAASTDWRKFLNCHPILEHLRKYEDRLRTLNDVKEWMAVKEGNLFIWNPRDASILTTNVKHQVLKNSLSSESGSSNVVQTLTLSRLPISEVERILLSPSGRYLALQSRNELFVVQLPEKWGKEGKYEGEKDRVTCRVIAVAERLLLGAGMRIIAAEWHPGSVDDSHVTLLTSDNYIRTYDIQRPSSPVESIRVCSSESDDSIAPCSSFQRVLGEGMVDFDFGAVVEVERKKLHLGSTKSSASTSTKWQLWPVYVLQGDGDVYQVFSCLDPIRPPTSQLQGPLAMYPPAEDNYGTDACAVCCLPGTPPVLVIVTLDGKLYNCVILSSPDGAVLDKKSNLEGSFDDCSQIDQIQKHALFMYDVIQLELSVASLPLQDQDKSLPDDFSCLMRLQKDVTQPDRYLCCHGAGLHAVVLPWYSKMQEYTREVDDADVPKFSAELQAVVEHLVCTKPLNSSEAAPLLGTCILKDKLLPNVIISLTQSLDLIGLPLRSSYRGSPPSLLSDQPLENIQSPLKQLHTGSFETHVKRILQKDSTLPLLRSSKGTELNSEACLQILGQTVQVLREQYILKQTRAREDIQRRVELLKNQREQQEEDIKRCLETKNKLTERAQELAEKYQEAADTQEELVFRLETVLKKLHARSPMMSDAEKNMYKELKNMEDRVRIFKSKIQQMTGQYRLKLSNNNRSLKRASPGFSSRERHDCSEPLTSWRKGHLDHLRTLLQKEGDDIADLVQQINQLKTSVDS